jgi:hypothetical protein
MACVTGPALSADRRAGTLSQSIMAFQSSGCQSNSLFRYGLTYIAYLLFSNDIDRLDGYKIFVIYLENSYTPQSFPCKILINSIAILYRFTVI